MRLVDAIESGQGHRECAALGRPRHGRRLMAWTPAIHCRRDDCGGRLVYDPDPGRPAAVLPLVLARGVERARTR